MADGKANMSDESLKSREQKLLAREMARLRRRRHGRRAYIRSVYFLPSLATLGNAVCGFAAMYVATLNQANVGDDPLTIRLAQHSFTYAALLVFAAMLFDAIDGRLARLTRHTTDFGGQLDSLADVISFGAAPALIALQVFKQFGPEMPDSVSRAVWAVGAMYLGCAALRLARFNVSNEHGEQHHFSFLGLPSPAAGGLIAALILLHQQWAVGELSSAAGPTPLLVEQSGQWMLGAKVLASVLPVALFGCAVLMVSQVRYPHLVNRYLRGRRSFVRTVVLFGCVLLLVVMPQMTLAGAMLIFVLWGPCGWLFARWVGAKQAANVRM